MGGEVTWPLPIPPRRWQADALPRVLDAMRRRQRPVVQAATGAGKTMLQAALVATAIPRLNGRRAVVLVPSVALVRQTVEAFRAVGIPAAPWYGGERDLAPVVVACVPSAPDLPREPIAFALVDECHGDAERVQAWLGDRRPAAVAGVTATPFGLHESWDLAYRYRLDAALADGVVVPLAVRLYQRDARADAMMARLGAVDETTADDAILSMVADTEGPGVVDCYDVADAVEYAARLTAHGIPAAAIYGAMPDREWSATVEAARTGQIRALCQIATLVEGVDLPWLRWIALRRRIGSPRRLVQLIGRGVRTYPGKTECIVLDPLQHPVLRRFLDDPSKGYADLDDADESGRMPPEELPPAMRAAPLAVAVTAIEAWAAATCDALAQAGLAVQRRRPEGADGPATDVQVATLGRALPRCRWLPASMRESCRALLANPRPLTRGAAADVLAAVRAVLDHADRIVERGGYPAAASWQRRLGERLAVVPLPAEIIESVRGAA